MNSFLFVKFSLARIFFYLPLTPTQIFCNGPSLIKQNFSLIDQGIVVAFTEIMITKWGKGLGTVLTESLRISVIIGKWNVIFVEALK